jgi:hypothetical protein
MIIPWIESPRCMSHALTAPDVHRDTPHKLNPNLTNSALEIYYYQAAVQLFRLFQHGFPYIGSLCHRSDAGKNTPEFEIGARPITLNMSNMIQLAHIPPAALPNEDKIYRTADEWYVALAEQHMAQLIFQHNDLVKSADDCRNKYVARQLFLRLAREGRLSTFGFAEDSWSAQSKSSTKDQVKSNVIQYYSPYGY